MSGTNERFRQNSLINERFGIVVAIFPISNVLLRSACIYLHKAVGSFMILFS